MSKKACFHPITGAHTQTIENKNGQWKSWVRRRYGVHDKPLPSHPKEFNWRERFGERNQVFFNFWSQVTTFFPCQNWCKRFEVAFIPTVLFRATFLNKNQAFFSKNGISWNKNSKINITNVFPAWKNGYRDGFARKKFFDPDSWYLRPNMVTSSKNCFSVHYSSLLMV